MESNSNHDVDENIFYISAYFLWNSLHYETLQCLDLRNQIFFSFSRDMNSIPQYPETLCPNFTDIAADPDKNKGQLLH